MQRCGDSSEKMGKRNSKLKQDTIDKLLKDTYCKYTLLRYSQYIHNEFEGFGVLSDDSTYLSMKTNFVRLN